MERNRNLKESRTTSPFFRRRIAIACFFRYLFDFFVEK